MSIPADNRGRYFGHQDNLMESLTSFQSATLVGTAYAVAGTEGDQVNSAEQRFQAAIYMNKGGVTGSARAYILTSLDGVRWQTAGIGTTQTTDGESMENVELEFVQQYVGAVVVRVAPGTFKTKIDLVSNGKFSLSVTTKTQSQALATVPAAADAEATKAGMATVTAGQTTKAVAFAKPYSSSSYSISLSSGEAIGLYWASKTASGFTITLPVVLAGDLNVDWLTHHP